MTISFDAMLRGALAALEPNGLFFCRLASSIGMESQVRPVKGRRFRLPDGSERYLVDEALLVKLTEALGGQLADPFEDDCRAEPTLDDHVGCTQKRLDKLS